MNITLEKIESIFRDRQAGEIGKYRHFSILVPLVETDEGLKLLFEVRSKEIKRQPGEICYPGGFCEKGESYLEAAVRECCEELGLSKEDMTIISQLDNLVNYSGFTIHCYLGKITEENYKKIRPQKEEVSEIFLVPLEWFLENEPVCPVVEILPVIADDFPYDLLGLDNSYHWRKGQMEVPIYIYGDKIIWGITGRITKQFIGIIKG